MQKIKNKTKAVLTCPLLEGLDGRKMSKTYKNTIDLDDSVTDMFGKIMSMKDELIIRYFELVTDVDLAEIKKMEEDLKYNNENPRNLKAKLGREIVKLYHSEEAAMTAEAEFNWVFKEGGKPSSIPKVPAPKGKVDFVDFIVENDLTTSKSEARRLIKQNGVKFNDVKVTNIAAEETLKKGDIVI